MRDIYSKIRQLYMCCDNTCEYIYHCRKCELSPAV